MTLSLVRENGEVLRFAKKVIPTDPTAGMVRFRVLPDTKSPYWGFHTRPVAPNPAVNPTSPDKDDWPDTSRSWFTEEWQWFWVDVMSLQKYSVVFADLPRYPQPSRNIERNLIVSAFKDVTAGNKFMTDGNGTDKYNNYITGEMRGQDPKQQSKVTALNDVYSAWPVEENFRGVEMVRLDSFIAGLGPPKATLAILRDHRMHRARIIYKNGTHGDFAHLKGRPLLYPFVTSGPAWYPRNELQLIKKPA